MTIKHPIPNVYRLSHIHDSLLYKSVDKSNFQAADYLRKANLRRKTLVKSGSNSLVLPDRDLIEYYYFEHLLSLLSAKTSINEKLNSGDGMFVKYYLISQTEIAERMAQYLLLIITREARHVQNTKWPVETFDPVKELAPDVWAYVKNFPTNAYELLDFVVQQPPDNMTLAEYSKGLMAVFYHGSFNNGYGGPAWGEIAECYHKWVTGRTSLLSMCDEAFALCHNNGPIFNKGMFYQSYTTRFKKFLDVQRTGQILNLVNHSSDYNMGTKYCRASLMKLHSLYTTVKYSDVCMPIVNWNEVMKASETVKGTSKTSPFHAPVHPGSCHLTPMEIFNKVKIKRNEKDEN